MLTLRGFAKNIKRPLLGKVSLSEGYSGLSSCVLITSEAPNMVSKEYAPIISSAVKMKDETEKLNIPLVHGVKGLEQLSDGDVIEIFPDGTINVLYQINSCHNIIFVTSRCDCNCIMCPQPVDKGEGSLTEVNLNLISLISKSTKELALTGGEPTAPGNDLFRLILACRDLLPQTDLLLLTNGRKFANYEYARFFSSLRHPNITVGIPLYGDNNIEHDRIMGSKGAFDQTIQGILNLASFTNQIEIRTVIHKLTFDKLLRLSEFVYRNLTFVKHIAFMGLETIGRGRENFDLLWIEPKEICPTLEKAVHYLVQRGMNPSIYNIPLCLLPKSLWRYARRSISEWKDSFASVCSICSVKKECSGVFDSGFEFYSSYLRPII
jgi:His-Xaa-Ser system radical SAM maturase HxsC